MTNDRFQKKEFIRDIVSIATENFYMNFKVEHILTKTFKDAVERTEVFEEFGFSLIGELYRGEYDNCYCR